MSDLEPTKRGIEALGDKWRGLRPLEKVGVVALGTVGAGAVIVLAAPKLVAATVGGGLAAGGAYLLRNGFR